MSKWRCFVDEMFDFFTEVVRPTITFMIIIFARHSRMAEVYLELHPILRFVMDIDSTDETVTFLGVYILSFAVPLLIIYVIKRYCSKHYTLEKGHDYQKIPYRVYQWFPLIISALGLLVAGTGYIRAIKAFPDLNIDSITNRTATFVTDIFSVLKDAFSSFGAFKSFLFSGDFLFVLLLIAILLTAVFGTYYIYSLHYFCMLPIAIYTDDVFDLCWNFSNYWCDIGKFGVLYHFSVLDM